MLYVMGQVKRPWSPLEKKNSVYKLARHFFEGTRVAKTTIGVDTIEGFITVVEVYQYLERDLKRVNTPVESQYKGDQKETSFQQGR